ncbi:MAG TPA: GNAT family N-acetyltransferase [Dehalococcoidia bacterium]|nr:GNAT family N-acetyltransferase [Dehalococcoidia bacterium]
MTTGQSVLRSLRPPDLPQVFDLLRTCFVGTPADHFVKQHLYDSTFRPWQGRVAEMDGRIVAYVRIFDRRMRVRGVPLRAAGIGSVATHPDFRHRALASALLTDAIGVMERRGYAISFLYTGVMPLYERLGWRVVAQPYLRAPVAELAGVGADRPYAVRGFGVADLPAIRRVLSRATRRATGAVVRSERYWRDHFWWANDDPRFFLVAERQGRIVAYLRGQVEAQRQRLVVLECETLPSARGAAQALVADAARRASALGLTMVYCQAPADSAIADAFRACPGAESRPTGRAPDMQLLVSPDRVLRGLLPLFRRAARVTPGPHVALAIGDVGVRLSAEDAEFLVAPGANAVRLDRYDAVLALLGQRSVVECLEPRTPTPAAAIDRLEAALPPCAYHFWYPDRI